MKPLSRDESVRTIYGAMIATDPTMTWARAEAAYDRVLADRALQVAEKKAEAATPVGVIEPDQDPENADWIRKLRPKADADHPTPGGSDAR